MPNLIDDLSTKIGDLAGSLIELKKSNGSTDNILDTKTAINRIFSSPDKEICTSVIYTNNIDKPFFGFVVMPALDAKSVIDLIVNDDVDPIKTVSLEIDSKIFSEYTNLTIYEITALLIREISHIVSDNSPVIDVKNAINDYLISTNQSLRITGSRYYSELLSFGFRDAIRKMNSVFEVSPDKYVNEFDKDLGISGEVLTAMQKIDRDGLNINSNVDNKLILLGWVLRLYNDILSHRIDAIHTLQSSMKMTGSKIEIREMQNVISSISKIDDASLLEFKFFDALEEKIKDISSAVKRNGIKSYEDDAYEMEFLCKNLETQEEALLYIHRINARMSVISDYLLTTKLDPKEASKWKSVLDRYNRLRMELSSRRIYQNRNRIYVNYGDYDD